MSVRTSLVFAASFLFVAAVWRLNFPVNQISGDTAIYATLGQSLWETGKYSIDGGTPYPGHLPWLAIISYPFTKALGANLGMKLLGLLAGLLTMIVTYIFLRRFFPQPVALAVPALLALHHSFNYLVTGGGIDLHYALLFFLTVLFLHKGLKESARWFLPMGICMGLTCIARYNGVFLAPFAAVAILYHYRTLRLPKEVFIGFALAAVPLLAWFLRNYLAFGSPFHSSYRRELPTDYLATIADNTLYYLNPLHNILPILFVCLLYGVARHWRGRGFLFWTMAAAFALTSIWTVSAMRYIFPLFPILLAFAAWGAWDLLQHVKPHLQKRVLAIGIAALTVSHVSMLCIYTIASCNVWFDRNVGLLPQEIPLTIEPRYSFAEAKDFINQNAPTGAQVLTPDQVETVSYERGVFRSDLIISELPGRSCPMYRIARLDEITAAVFVSTNVPFYAVEEVDCPDQFDPIL